MNIRKEWTSQDSLTTGYSNLYTKDETISDVQENFDIRRYQSAEGYQVSFNTDLSDSSLVATTDNVLIQSHTNPINQNKEDKKIHFPVDLEISRGAIVNWIDYDEDWMIISKVDNLQAYKSAQIYKTNYTLNWKNDEGKEISQRCILENFKFATDNNIKEDKYMIRGDGVRYITLQNNSDTRELFRDKRFIIDNRAWKIVEYDSTTKEGLYLLTLEEHQVNTQTDDVDNKIANSSGNETYTINIITDTIDISVGSTPIELEVETKLDGILVSSPSLIYTSSNDSIASVSSLGIITPVSNGSCTITISLDGNSGIYDTATITVTSSVASNISEIIVGSNSISKGLSSSYSIYKYVNGVDDGSTYTFAISSSDATLSAATDNTVVVTANVDTGSVILTATNVDTLDEITKTINLTTLW